MTGMSADFLAGSHSNKERDKNLVESFKPSNRFLRSTDSLTHSLLSESPPSYPKVAVGTQQSITCKIGPKVVNKVVF